MFDYALDITKLWKAKDVGLAEVDIKPDGVGTSARMYTHFLGFHMEGGGRVHEVVPGQRIVAQVHFSMEKPTWTFTFAPVKSGTKVTAEREWHVGLPVAGGRIEGMRKSTAHNSREGWLPAPRGPPPPGQGRPQVVRLWMAGTRLHNVECGGRTAHQEV